VIVSETWTWNFDRMEMASMPYGCYEKGDAKRSLRSPRKREPYWRH
jgi:hypothetical protein